MSTTFGQLVIGPAGSGKTTYCQVIADHLTRLNRKVIIVNIDPANDNLPYKADVDINQLVTVIDVMDRLGLGPNGALLYCIDTLDTNIEWLIGAIQEKIQAPDNCQPPYLVFDCPGQVELYTNYNSFKNIITKLTSAKTLSKQVNCSNIDLRLVAVNLVDAHYTNEPSKFISVLMTSLSAMLQLELPHVNVLSKMDLMEKYGNTHFNPDFYCDILDLNYLTDRISEDKFFEKYKKLTKAIAGVIEDYSLVSFVPLDINHLKTILNVIRIADKANGYYLNDLDASEQIEKLCNESESNESPYVDYFSKLLEQNKR